MTNHLFSFLKKNISRSELQNFKNKIRDGRKNIHGIFNPIENLFNSNKEVISFTKQLLIKRYIKFGFKKKEIMSILNYLEVNKSKLPDKNRKFINKNFLNFHGDYYKSIIDSYIPKRYSITFKYINKILNLKKFKRIVDFGCGTNDLGRIIAEDKKKTVIGVDIINYSNNFKKKNLKYIKIKDPCDVPVKSFDLLILNGVIHHVDICYLDKLLSNIQKKMTSKSRVLLFEDSWSKIKLFKDKDLDIVSTKKLQKLNIKYGDNAIIAIYSFLDWIGNILARNLRNISMPYNFNSDEDWEKIFSRKGMKLVKKLNIGFFKNTLNRQGYVLMVFKKNFNKKTNFYSKDDFLYKYLNNH